LSVSEHGRLGGRAELSPWGEQGAEKDRPTAGRVEGGKKARYLKR